MFKSVFFISLVLCSVYNSFAQRSGNRVLFEGFVKTLENNNSMRSNRGNRAYFEGFPESNAPLPIENSKTNIADLKKIKDIFLPYINRDILRVKELYEELNPGLYEFSILFKENNADELFLSYNREYRTRFPKYLSELHGCDIDNIKVAKRKIINLGETSNYFRNPNQDYFEVAFEGNLDFGVKSVITFFLIEVGEEYKIIYLKSLK